MARTKGSVNTKTAIFDKHSTPRDVADRVGVSPGLLTRFDVTGATDVQKLRRQALFYFARRWLDFSREEAYGDNTPGSATVALGNVIHAYNSYAAKLIDPDHDTQPSSSPPSRVIPFPAPVEDHSVPATPSPVTPTSVASDPPASNDLQAALNILGRHMAPAVDENTVKRLIQEALDELPTTTPKTHRIEIQINDTPTRDLPAEPRHTCFEEVLRAVSVGLNVLLVGPAGSGKTHLAEQIAAALDQPFSFNGAINSEFKLSGFIDAQGRYQTTAYRRWFENGGVHLFDEIDGSSANALLYVNAGLANGHQDFPDQQVSRHAKAHLLASANTYGNGADRQYVGRNQLDAASSDRFYPIFMDYDENLEISLYGDNEWVRYVQQVRAATRRLGMRHVISMRAIDQGLKALSAGISRAQVEKAVLWRHLSGVEIEKIKADLRF